MLDSLPLSQTAKLATSSAALELGFPAAELKTSATGMVSGLRTLVGQQQHTNAHTSGTCIRVNNNRPLIFGTLLFSETLCVPPGHRE